MTWPGALHTFTLPVTGVPLATAPGSAAIVGAGLTAIQELEAWLNAPPVNVVAASGAAQQLPDPRIFPFSSITWTGNCACAMPALIPGRSFVVQGIQDVTGSRLPTFTGVRWDHGIAPTVTPTAGSVDLYGFTGLSTHWYGFILGQAMA